MGDRVTALEYPPPLFGDSGEFAIVHSVSVIEHLTLQRSDVEDPAGDIAFLRDTHEFLRVALLLLSIEFEEARGHFTTFTFQLERKSQAGAIAFVHDELPGVDRAFDGHPMPLFGGEYDFFSNHCALDLDPLQSSSIQLLDARGEFANESELLFANDQ